METNQHTNFENGWSDAFSNFTPQPDPSVWSRIEAGLQRRKRIVLFYRFAAAASLLLLFSVSGWLAFNFTNDPSQHSTLPLAETEYQPTQTFPDEDYPEKRSHSHSDQLPVIADVTTTKPETQLETPQPTNGISTKHEAPAIAQAIEIQPALRDEIQAVEEIPEPIIVILPSDEPALASADEAEKPAISLEEIQHLLFPDNFEPVDKDASKWQLAMGYGTIHNQTTSDQSNRYESNTANFSKDPYSSTLSGETRQFESIENTKHAQPLTLGLIVHRSFGGAWGLETGLLFTRLRTTTLTPEFENSFVEMGSEITYLGLPLSVRLNMIYGRRFGMYLSQGVVFEKGINTRYYANEFVNGELLSTQRDSYIADGFQLSSLTSIGFEYRISERFSLYAQPGLQVFFLNKTQPYNIRSSSAIWPSLQSGLRFQI